MTNPSKAIETLVAMTIELAVRIPSVPQKPNDEHAFSAKNDGQYNRHGINVLLIGLLDSNSHVFCTAISRTSPEKKIYILCPPE